MRLGGVILLTVLFVALVSPLTMHVVSTGQEEHLITLDVCHDSDTALSINADSPVLFESFCRLHAFEVAGIHEPGGIVLTSNLSSHQQERPPRI